MRTKIKKMRIGDKIIIYSNQYNKTDQVGYYGKITIVRRKKRYLTYSGEYIRNGETGRFYGFTQNYFKLLCNKQRECKNCSNRLQCITQGVI